MKGKKGGRSTARTRTSEDVLHSSEQDASLFLRHSLFRRLHSTRASAYESRITKSATGVLRSPFDGCARPTHGNSSNLFRSPFLTRCGVLCPYLPPTTRLRSGQLHPLASIPTRGPACSHCSHS
ncbi:BZ3500_MvSof-1268-A1-R1_Chr3-1g05853 [Microbotryum saponariae]|uniref:BZ3500_MvSof-1268-A1-R1_Chr3-1g05853 protein n=1 Tax=Microbotryum saponariae TaxID=289078 RepID=A0A2X0LJK3_9BASI|nr:BZ3500_MvSof-1268-A1-R1_Chr3-1g05853 [Microbotryum saponariae]SDA05043.1 BZ3501_MvSof-1269-A2-R1_Chr3-1g05523 [Microbotryum saponariae]